MSNELLGTVGILTLLLLMFLRVPVGYAMALSGIGGIALILEPQAAISILKTVPFSTTAAYNLSVIPLFVFMGELALVCGMTSGLFNAFHKSIGHWRGGLAMAAILASSLFAAICGSSPATAAAMGKVVLPEMSKYNYNKDFAAATVVAGGSLGSLIPPSVVGVIYGVLTEQSIGKVILALLIPGFFLCFLYIITAYIVARRHPELAPSGPRYSFKDKLKAFKGITSVLVIFVVSIGGIYLGYFTATEGAGVGCFLVLIYSLLTRNLTWKRFVESLMETGRVTGISFTIFIGAMIFSTLMTLSRWPMMLSEFITGLQVSTTMVIICIIVGYLVLGCFMDSLAMIFITVPIFFPIILNLGLDPIWFGVLVVSCSEAGLITPPVGMNLFVVSGIAQDVKMVNLYKAVIPYCIAIVIFLIILALFPELALWLPQHMTK